MDSINIRAATKEEALAILNSEGVKERLEIEPNDIKQGFLFLVNDRMLLILIDHSQKDIEAHIGQPKKHWPYIHNDIKDALIFISELGYNSVYTNVRNELKKTLNLLRKHGFKQVEQNGKEDILKWESKQLF